MLARRYLNPRRAMLSSFTLISLVGVILGVLVLVVVMAVYAGLERDVKERLLGFTPHVLVKSASLGALHPQELSEIGEGEVSPWEDLAREAESLEGVAAATAYVADNVILDVNGWQRPVSFRAIDTSDAEQVRGVEKMLDSANFPEGSADLGIDDRAVISSIVANQYQLRIGDTMRLYSTRNFENVMAAYKVTEAEVVRDAYPVLWAQAEETFKNGWVDTESGDSKISVAPLAEIYEGFRAVYDEEIREPEKILLENLLIALEVGARGEGEEFFRFEPEQKLAVTSAFEDLGNTDKEKMDGEILKSLRDVVLPKEVIVSGVYAASQMAVTPELFVPLPLAQDLAGLGDQVQGVALRLNDAYASEEVAIAGRAAMEGSFFETWGDQYQAFFALINQQRVMMYFALSFIVLVSAFSMMAVMFTVTIQKRREIGVMMALGAAPGQIVRVFLYQGMILGILGAVIGVGLGRIVIHFRGQLQEALRVGGFDPFSAQLTGFGILPAYNDPKEQVVIAIIAFILCSLAALVPAFFASRSDAAKSLRNL